MRIAKDSDLYVGRKVIACHNRATAEYFTRQDSYDDWDEFPCEGNFFVISEEQDYN